MKRFTYTIMLLAIAGSVLSGQMTLEYYYPDMNLAISACADSITSPCTSVHQSAYASFLGIPVAVYGLLFYLFILFTILVADYASENYYLHSAVILFPLIVMGLLVDILLAIALINLRLLCTSCIASYVITILLLIVLILWLRAIKRDNHISFGTIIKTTLAFGKESPDRRAVLSLYILFAFFLSFALFTTSYTLKIKTHTPQPPRERIEAFVNRFFASPPDEIELPASSMTLGNPKAPVTIVVFTDFLCSACYKFFLIEKHLFARFHNKIRIVYYNFPLDSACNRYIINTRYPNSCIASRALIASALVNNFEKYLLRHFNEFKNGVPNYNQETSIAIAASLMDTDQFIQKLESPEITDILTRDTELAKAFRINATPTMFIQGRKLIGVLPQAVLEAIIERALEE
jgi:protein-disulfide isomerase/uncharacterized membrane protein